MSNNNLIYNPKRLKDAKEAKEMINQAVSGENVKISMEFYRGLGSQQDDCLSIDISANVIEINNPVLFAEAIRKSDIFSVDNPRDDGTIDLSVSFDYILEEMGD